MSEFAVFPLLPDVQAYQPCAWDLAREHDRRAYWLGLFRSHFPKLLAEVIKQDSSAASRQRCDVAAEIFYAYLNTIEADPTRFGHLDILTICHQRESALRQAGIDDAYASAKSQQNAAALPLLPALLDELDATDLPQRAARVIHGVFAGNIFDLGATKTVDMFHDKAVDFHAVLGQLSPRPWLIDDYDRWMARWLGRPRHRSAVLFVDNAGCDIVLGMIPLARCLLQMGTDVLLTANTFPSLNDVTHAELTEMLAGIAAWDPVLGKAWADGRLECVPSGNHLPLIDLSKVSTELARAVTRRGVDLVILEGMGRALESNLTQPLAVDTLKLAMVKDQGVAEALGGKLFDLVMQYDPPV